MFRSYGNIIFSGGGLQFSKEVKQKEAFTTIEQRVFIIVPNLLKNLHFLSEGAPQFSGRIRQTNESVELSQPRLSRVT